MFEGWVLVCQALTVACVHLVGLEPVEPVSYEGCEECLVAGDRWLHLRLCMQCGHVGCCDGSSNRHATRHFEESGHGVVQSFEPGEKWAYCYIDDDFVESIAPELDRHYR